MDNLARIISHGFAIVVVVLLGIGFVYRGELFPDLELPDFLVPESGKTADAGAHPDHIQAETSAPAASPSGEPAEGTPSTPATAAEQAMGESAAQPGAAIEAPEVPPVGEVTGAEGAAVESAAAGLERPATIGESEEPPPAAAEESPPHVVEQQVPAGSAAPVTEAGAPGGAVPESAQPPVLSEDTAGEPPVEASGTATGTQADAVLREVSPEPAIETGTPAEIEPPGGAQISGAGEEAALSETSPDQMTPGTAAPVPGSAPVTSPAIQPAGKPTVAAKPYELLAAAREAFWLHNYEDAEKNYRALTELEPDNPDGYGELGNMYFSQGRWDEAAAAYYEAGTRLVAEGRLDAARELVNVIRGLNGKQADALDKLISSAASTGNN